MFSLFLSRKTSWADDDPYPSNNFDTFFGAVLSIFVVLSGENWNEVYYDQHAASYQCATYAFIYLLSLCVFMYIYTHTYVFMYVFMHSYVRIYVHLYVCMYIYIGANPRYIYICVCVCIVVYTYRYTPSS